MSWRGDTAQKRHDMMNNAEFRRNERILARGETTGLNDPHNQSPVRGERKWMVLLFCRTYGADFGLYAYPGLAPWARILSQLTLFS